MEKYEFEKFVEIMEENRGLQNAMCYCNNVIEKAQKDKEKYEQFRKLIADITYSDHIFMTVDRDDIQRAFEEVGEETWLKNYWKEKAANGESENNV